jgi:hypothetical protein
VIPCPYCNATGCEDCHDGAAPCVTCDLPAVTVLDGDPLCRRCHDANACAECGERHPTEDHYPLQRGWAA